MDLLKVQKTILDYLKGHLLFNMLLPFSAVLTLVYCGYCVLYDISFFSFIFSGIYAFSGILSLAYVVGLIISFAKNDMIIIMLAFALRIIDSIIELITFSVVPARIHCIFDILIYGFLAYMAMLRFNKTGGKLQ